MSTSYLESAQSDAADMADHFVDEIVESFIDNDGEASNDLLNDYSGGDRYHHETHIDKTYSLQEASDLLDELDDYEETDEGLWEGQKPREAISSQAAYTYGNAVYSLWRDIIGTINDDPDLSELLDSYLEVDDKVADELSESEASHEGEDDWEPPFDESDEADDRKEKIKAKIKEKIEALIKEAQPT